MRHPLPGSAKPGKASSRGKEADLERIAKKIRQGKLEQIDFAGKARRGGVGAQSRRLRHIFRSVHKTGLSIAWAA